MSVKCFFNSAALIFMIASSSVYSASLDLEKSLDRRCSHSYQRIDNFLQYLYKVDGNLKDLNPSKIKRIEHLENIFEDAKTTESQSIAAFKELFSDPDWWIYKLQRNSRKLIGQLESVKKNANWETYKKLVAEQVAGKLSKFSFQPSATMSIEGSVELIVKTSDFFAERTEIMARLEALGASSRLSRAFSEDTQQDAFESRLYLRLPSQLIRCQINFLENRLNTKP